MGSGGTLAGVAMALRERNPTIAIGLADPFGAALFNFYKRNYGDCCEVGRLLRSAEGIGQGRVTANLQGLDVDYPYRIADEEMLRVIFDLAEHEVLSCHAALARQASTSPAPFDLPATWDRATPSSPFSPITARAIRANCSTVDLLTERGLPTPPWL